MEVMQVYINNLSMLLLRLSVHNYNKIISLQKQ